MDSNMQIITAIVMFLTGANQISIHNYLINIFAHKQVHTSAVVHVHRAKKLFHSYWYKSWNAESTFHFKDSCLAAKNTSPLGILLFPYGWEQRSSLMQRCEYNDKYLSTVMWHCHLYVAQNSWYFFTQHKFNLEVTLIYLSTYRVAMSI